MTVSSVAHDLIVTAIDLTRACTEQELYIQWLALHSDALHGSAGIANYLANAALAFEEQAHPQFSAPFDAFVARENLSDLLMVSIPNENSPLFRSKNPPPSGDYGLQFQPAVEEWNWLVKRRRALVETNPPRNSRPQTHRDDGLGGAAVNGFASGLKPDRIDRFADA